METKNDKVDHPENSEEKNKPKAKKQPKGTSVKRGGDPESSGGSRQGNAGYESDKYGSFGNR